MYIIKHMQKWKLRVILRNINPFFIVRETKVVFSCILVDYFEYPLGCMLPTLVPIYRGDTEPSDKFPSPLPVKFQSCHIHADLPRPSGTKPLMGAGQYSRCLLSASAGCHISHNCSTVLASAQCSAFMRLCLNFQL